MGRYTSYMKDSKEHKSINLGKDYFEGLWPFVGLGLYWQQGNYSQAYFGYRRIDFEMKAYYCKGGFEFEIERAYYSLVLVASLKKLAHC